MSEPDPNYAQTMQPNPNPNTPQFLQAIHFLRLLSCLDQKTSSPTDTYRRIHHIRLAAFISMARAVRPPRPWSAALLRSLRSRQGPRAMRSPGMTTRRSSRRADELRRLVPGGRGMGLCCLLEETAHYIESLRSQVKLMQMIAAGGCKVGKEE